MERSTDDIIRSETTYLVRITALEIIFELINTHFSRRGLLPIVNKIAVKRTALNQMAVWNVKFLKSGLNHHLITLNNPP